MASTVCLRRIRPHTLLAHITMHFFPSLPPLPLNHHFISLLTLICLLLFILTNNTTIYSWLDQTVLYVLVSFCACLGKEICHVLPKIKFTAKVCNCELPCLCTAFGHITFVCTFVVVVDVVVPPPSEPNLYLLLCQYIWFTRRQKNEMISLLIFVLGNKSLHSCQKQNLCEFSKLYHLKNIVWSLTQVKQNICSLWALDCGWTEHLVFETCWVDQYGP